MLDGDAVMADRASRSGTESPVLRVGLLVGADRAPRWVADLIRALDLEEAIDVRRVEAGTTAMPSGVRGADRSGDVAGWLRTLYRRVDTRLFGRADDPVTQIRLRQLVDRLPAAAPSDLDVILVLAGRADTVPSTRGDDRASDDSADAPLWLRLRHESVAGGPDPGDVTAFADLADTLAGTALTVTALVADGRVGGERVVGRAVSPTDVLSARRGGRNHWPKVARLPVTAMLALCRNGQLPGVADPKAMHVEPKPVPHTATSTARALARIVTGYLARFVDRTLAPERWIVALYDASGRSPMEDTAIVPDPRRVPYTIVHPPDDVEWADPFLVDTKSGVLLFVEEWVRSRGRGRISVIPLDGSRAAGPSIPVLDLDHHLSYPFVFRWQGTWYLMPEQAAGGTLELYRATDFPTAWTWDRTVLALPAADATIEEIDGRWWLFASLPGLPGTAPDELHLFHGETPLGPWEPHQANPVVTDVRTARPAGRLFRANGAWYRPAQNGGPTYGFSVMVLRIEHLDQTSYREQIVAEIEPGWAPGVSATHTFNRSGAMTAIDARLREPRWRLPGSRRRRMGPGPAA